MTKNLTRNGVAKDLTQSPYVFTYMHKGSIITLFFSSRLHLNNFTKKRSENYYMIYNSLYKRFKVIVDCTLISDLNLYHKIEKRGCFVRINDKGYRDLKTIIIK